MVSTGDDYGRAIAVDNLGYSYITGSFGYNVDFDPGPGVYYLNSTNILLGGATWDQFILKLDPSGNFVWAKQIGGMNGIDQGTGIALDALNNVYTVGEYGGNPGDSIDFDPGTGIHNLIFHGGGSDLFVSKYDAAGNFIWAKNISGINDEGSSSIAVDQIDNVYIGTYFGANGVVGGYTVDFDPGPGVYNLTSTTQWDMSNALVKLNNNGNFIWAKSLPIAPNAQLFYTSLTANASCVCATGFFSGTADFNPDPLTSYNLTDSGNLDVFILKLDPSGNFQWAKRIGGASEDVGFAITLGSGNEVYTAGEFWGNVDFNPSIALADTFNVHTSGGAGAFVCRLNTSGNFVWAAGLGDQGQQSFAHAIATDEFGYIYTAGEFIGPCDFDPGVELTDTFTLNSFNGSTDIFIHKLGQNNSIGISENIPTNEMSCFPNPTNGLLNIHITTPNENALAEVYDNVGAIVLTKKLYSETSIIDLRNFADGLYFVKLMNGNNMITSKKISKQ